MRSLDVCFCRSVYGKFFDVERKQIHQLQNGSVAACDIVYSTIESLDGKEVKAYGARIAKIKRK